MSSAELLGLNYATLAELKASLVPGLPPARPPETISTVAVIGAGTMGRDIAKALLNARLNVILVDRNAEALVFAASDIERSIASAVEKGRSTAGQAAEQRARLSVVDSLEKAARAQLHIETAFEDFDVKCSIFEQLDRIAQPNAILATNTSTLDLDRIADRVRRPERVIGLHFFIPAHVMKLLEIVRGRRTDPQIVADALALARRMDKVGVVAGVCNGFIGNRVFEECLRQAYFLLEEGALPTEIDRAMENWGFTMGPLRIMDLAGQDVGWKIRKQRATEQPNRPYSKIPDKLAESGRYGQKSGSGYYVYGGNDRRGRPDPEIEALVVAYSASLGLTRKTFTEDEIIARCILTMVNEGARILEEGVASRPLDIDALFLNGYGLARRRGGLMFYADSIGLPKVLDRIEQFARGYQGWAWAPSPRLAGAERQDFRITERMRPGRPLSRQWRLA